MKKTLYKIFFAIIVLSSPVTSLAAQETTVGGQLLARISPKDPGAFTDTSISLTSYEIDLARSNLAWTINGVVQREGVGLTSLQFATGPIGKKIVIKIEAASLDGKNIKKEVSIVPADVELLWQSDGYVPPLYRGKSTLATGNNVKLAALPNFITETGAKIDPLKLYYNWRVNSVDVASGYGLNSITTNITESFSDNTFFVEASSLDGILRASKLVRIGPVNPMIVLYKQSPLLGTLYEKSLLSNIQMDDAEMTIKAEPYFFDTNTISYKWRLNNEPSEEGFSGNQITVRQPPKRGESLLSVRGNSLSQSAEKNITIKFGATTFGF